MNKTKAKIYSIEVVLLVVLATCTLLHITNNKMITATILFAAAIIISFLLKRKRILKTTKKKILIIMIIFGILYISLFYTLGLYTGFFNSTTKFGLKTIIKYIIPITIVIITTEQIRSKLLIEESILSYILIIIISTIIDISLYLDLYNTNSLENILAVVGFIVFASIANNILYTYINKKYGIKPVLIYRLITTLYIYIFPIIPDVYIFFRTFIRMIYPLIIYLYIEKYYNQDKYQERPKELRKEAISLGIGSTIIMLLIALISCKFKYGVLVIGSTSMLDSIDKGDVVFFVNTKKEIKEKDIIVFQKEDIKIVHRVVKIRNINNERRYYTKGDANITQDEGYVTKQNLKGKVLFKIKYLGKPTLYLRSLFDKEG